MTETPAVILSNTALSGDHFEMELELAGKNGITSDIRPGQFCMLSVNDPSRVLRRPFSIFRIPAKDRINVFYRTAGEGTRILSGLGKGTTLSALLPLGNGFRDDPAGPTNLLMAAGGIGFASLHPLFDLHNKKKRLYYGARTAGHLYPLKERDDAVYSFATDDGSKGYRGSVNDLVIKALENRDVPADDVRICACGPFPMLRDLYERVRKKYGRVPMEFCLEERMACGVGVCMGCVVHTKLGLLRSCTDGPVFDADIIDWEFY